MAPKKAAATKQDDEENHPEQGREVAPPRAKAAAKAASSPALVDIATSRMQDQAVQANIPVQKPAPVLHTEKNSEKKVISKLSDIDWRKLQKNALILMAAALGPQEDDEYWLPFEASGLGLRILSILQDLADGKKKIVDAVQQNKNDNNDNDANNDDHDLGSHHTTAGSSGNK